MKWETRSWKEAEKVITHTVDPDIIMIIILMNMIIIIIMINLYLLAHPAVFLVLGHQCHAKST